MTHQDLLDVTTQLDDVRDDREAVQLACRVARTHLRAAHTALVAVEEGEPHVVASEGPAAESPLAWRELCRADGPGALVSVDGWHLAAAQEAAYRQHAECAPVRQYAESRRRAA